MKSIYNLYKNIFIGEFGEELFNRLYYKVNFSNALIRLSGLTINKSLPPNAMDFLESANRIPYVILKFNIGISVMASLIELKI